MLTENDVKGLIILSPHVIDTAAKLSPRDRDSQIEVCGRLSMVATDFRDKHWLACYAECLIFYCNNLLAARRASFEADKHTPPFITAEFCKKQLRIYNNSKKEKKNGGKSKS